MKFWIRLSFLTIIDFIVIWLYVKWEDPDPSVSIGILLLIPFVIVINLVIALYFYRTKRHFAILFIANIIPSAILMNYLFSKGIDRHQNLRYESWTFQIKDTTYEVTHYKIDNGFYMTYRTNPNSSTSFLSGKFVDNEKFYTLITDTTKYTIKNNFLFDFRSDSIKLIQSKY
jgi:hypothetical protein